MSDTSKTAPVDFVYDHPDGARRPTEDDVDPFTVDVTPAPLPQQLYSAQMNQRGRCIPALARVSCVAILTIDFDAGAPYIDRLSSCSEVLVIGDLTVVDGGTGITTITWDAGALPTSVASPDASVVTDGAWLQPTAVAVTNGVQVKTRASGGALTDVRTTVRIY